MKSVCYSMFKGYGNALIKQDIFNNVKEKLK